jgi:hypothetical protein
MQEMKFAPRLDTEVQIGSLLGERTFRNYRGTISFDKFQGNRLAILKDLPVYSNFCPHGGDYARFQQTDAGNAGRGRISNG